MFAWRFCIVYKRALNNVKMVLYMQQKGIEVASRRFCAAYNLSMKLLQGNLYDNHQNIQPEKSETSQS